MRLNGLPPRTKVITGSSGIVLQFTFKWKLMLVIHILIINNLSNFHLLIYFNNLFNIVENCHCEKYDWLLTIPSPLITTAPIILLIAAISGIGPAIREVPVSAIAWQPFAQKVRPATLTLQGDSVNNLLAYDPWLCDIYNLENNHILIHSKLPVSFASNRNICEISLVMIGIGATQYHFTSDRSRGISVQIVYFLYCMKKRII